MKLIAFPHYTCGGLLSDIFSNTFSPIINGGLASFHHGIGKIGDADSIMDSYDPLELMHKVKHLINSDVYVGTHCWPGLLDYQNFEQIIVVTTTTARSRLYRWARVYNHYYINTPEWTELSGVLRIDKERETAKNYLKSFGPVNFPNAINIEFSEVVKTTAEFLKLVDYKDINSHVDRWRTVNQFLFDPVIWTCTAAQRLHEAEIEVNLNRHYIYE